MSGGLYLGSVSLTGTVSENLPVNINASNGTALTETDGNLNVNVSNLLASPVQSQLILDGGEAGNVLARATIIGGVNNVSVFQASLQTQTTDDLFGGVINPANTYGFELTNLGCKQIAVFGRVEALAGGTTPANITIRYSTNGSTYYDTSLGVINLTTVAQEFSRDWVTGAKWVGFKCDSAATITLAISACQ